jgi:hypothetical protein
MIDNQAQNTYYPVYYPMYYPMYYPIYYPMFYPIYYPMARNCSCRNGAYTRASFFLLIHPCIYVMLPYQMQWIPRHEIQLQILYILSILPSALIVQSCFYLVFKL